MREHVWRGANGEAWTPEAPTDNCSRCGGTPDSHPTMERAPKWDANWPAAERLPEEAWQAVRDEDWQVLPAPDPIRGCRFHVALRTECRRPAVARMQRNRAEHRYIWRHYCEQHMFNRWIENGLVLNWTVRPEWRDARVPA